MKTMLYLMFEAAPRQDRMIMKLALAGALLVLFVTAIAEFEVLWSAGPEQHLLRLGNLNGGGNIQSGGYAKNVLYFVPGELSLRPFAQKVQYALKNVNQ